MLAWSKDWAGKLMYVGDDRIPYLRDPDVGPDQLRRDLETHLFV